MNFRRFTFTLILFAISTAQVIKGQEASVFNNYYLSPFIVNPALPDNLIIHRLFYQPVNNG